MPVFITYDVSREQSGVKQLMLKCGYQDNFRGADNIIYHLPDTTLWHPAFDMPKAIVDLQSVTQTLGVVLHRAIAIPGDRFAGIPGEARK
jgi:hypothetical protein